MQINKPVAQIPQCTTPISNRMYHFVIETYKYMHISVTKWCIVDPGLWGSCLMHCGICEMGQNDGVCAMNVDIYILVCGQILP